MYIFHSWDVWVSITAHSLNVDYKFIQRLQCEERDRGASLQWERKDKRRTSFEERGDTAWFKMVSLNPGREECQGPDSTELLGLWGTRPPLRVSVLHAIWICVEIVSCSTGWASWIQVLGCRQAPPCPLDCFDSKTRSLLWIPHSWAGVSSSALVSEPWITESPFTSLISMG